MGKKELEKKLAYLEFVNDQLVTEVTYVDSLLKSIGFPEGLHSVKLVANEILDEQLIEGEECEY